MLLLDGSKKGAGAPYLWQLRGSKVRAVDGSPMSEFFYRVQKVQSLNGMKNELGNPSLESAGTVHSLFIHGITRMVR